MMTARHPSALAAALRAFARRDDGVLTVAGTFVFVMMMLAGGVAIDFMRVETTRAKLQYTLDRAVLAAASLSQDGDGQRVVQDYLRAAGLEGYPVDVRFEVDTGTHRRVRAVSKAPIRSMFMHLLGVDGLVVPASSVAEERIRKIEMSLVLDVSGSMNEPSGTPGVTRIAALRQAAKRFVTRVLADRPGAVSISIVPYSSQVNIGPTLSTYFQLNRWHAYSSCAHFDVADYRTTAIPAGARLRQVAHVQPYLLADNDYSDLEGQVAGSCPASKPVDAFLTNDEAALHASIDRLTAIGGTAIDVGIKWGAALLDPASRDRVTAMIANRTVDQRFAGRPAMFNDEDTMKILVVMTDGRITNQYDVHSNRLTKGTGAKSGVFAWRSDFGSLSAADRMSAIRADRHDDARKLTFSIRDRSDPTIYREAFVPNPPSLSAPRGGTQAVELDYEALWDIKPTWYVAHVMAANMPRAIRDWYAGAQYQTYNEVVGDGVPDAVVNLRMICDAAKAPARHITIFTIGFLVEAGGADEMRRCASGPANFYDVQTGDIQSAFDQIARVITQLTLTE